VQDAEPLDGDEVDCFDLATYGGIRHGQRVHEVNDVARLRDDRCHPGRRCPVPVVEEILWSPFVELMKALEEQTLALCTVGRWAEQAEPDDLLRIPFAIVAKDSDVLNK
jgi:hypothetical protein